MADFRLAMSRFISQSLAFETLQRDFSALGIVDTHFFAGVHPEIEFGQVSVKMLLVHVLINPDKSALEDAEIALKRVGVNIAAHPFALGVIDRFMLTRSRHDELVGSRSVSDQAAILVQMLVHGASDVAMIQVHGAEIPVALDQGEYHRSGFRIQSGPDGFAGLGRLGEVGFVGFNGLAKSADLTTVILHGFTDTMSEEPCGFHAAIEHALNLPGADSFLAGAHQMDDLQPKMQRQVAGLENGPHAHGERLLAAVALAEPRPSGLAVQAADAISAAAKCANWAVRPEMRFDVNEGSGFVFKMGGVQYGSGHDDISYGLNSSLGA